jgi:hypothetical protein
VRSIQSSPPEAQFAARPAGNFRNRKNQFQAADEVTKGVNRRNDVEQKTKASTTVRVPAYRRRTFTTSTASSTQVPAKIESSTNRFKNVRKNVSDIVITTVKPRRQFTPRTTSENVLITTSDIPSSTKATATLKKVSATRGSFRPKTDEKESNDGNLKANIEEENYPEHFKLLLKNKETITEESDKSVLKKPQKPFRPSSADKSTKSPVPRAEVKKNNALFPKRPKQFTTRVTSTSSASPDLKEVTITTTKRPTLRTRPRPTDNARKNIGSTLQVPPTGKSSPPTYSTRSPVRHAAVEEPLNVNTQSDGMRQIDPPIRDYFPRTSANVSNEKVFFSRIY